MAERIEELRRALSVLLAKQAEGADIERLHIAADEALLWYIADDESIRLFDDLQKRY